MNRLKNIVGSGLVLMLALSLPPAWSQTADNNDTHEHSSSGVAYSPASSVSESASVMDQNLSREIKKAWSEGKNATAAMAFQENGEIALSEGKDQEAKQYFSNAEQELATLQPDQPGY